MKISAAVSLNFWMNSAIPAIPMPVFSPTGESTPFLALIPTLLILTGLRWYFNRKIGGYTGDCCGASVLLAEQFFYIGATIVYTYSL